MNSNFVLVNRAIKESSIWRRCSPECVKVWLTCLMDANWKDSRWFDGRAWIAIPRGSFATGRAALAASCGLSEGKVRTAMDTLDAMECITREVTSRYTIVKVTNYDVYQSGGGKTTSTLTSDLASALTSDLATSNKRRSKEEYYIEPIAAELDEFSVEVVRVSLDMKARHPGSWPAPPKMIQGQLRAICNALPKKERLDKLLWINENHKLWCLSNLWTKDGGICAGKLEKWLVPSLGRFEVAPVQPASPVSTVKVYDPETEEKPF